jgi:hypothetical protein
MSGECDSEISMSLVASLIKRNMEETQLKIAYQTLESSGMADEFQNFISENLHLHLFDAMREFAKLHPDKFYIPDEMEPYGKFIVLG